MDALQLLINRRSEKKLTTPAPNKTQLELIFQAALNVPDHGRLHPYRFVVIEEEALNKFGTLLKEAVYEFELGDEKLKKAENLAQRAPMIIAVVAKINKEAKVPAWEQMLCAACSTYAIQLAANAQGFANVWITGKWVDGNALRQALRCQESEKIIALLMIGTAEDKLEREKRIQDTDEFVQYLS
ncbi:NAD(P)H nitroreductase [Pasteurella canis]|uniref:Putative NAD(P)H nitroreductase n=1 Tax=Pasteurella canis TaxID=753 RepID=A0A379EU09_9PAST|nr:NAD(P)H nitroreductase [Pasteurella canis]UAX42819.1 NAD(P)H nitroreductase [Pasteurella canis]UDW84404.1 NAD(P)H nitroreductase [Pasteurella canis]UEA17402.1 NAD(P)H nitroreductase [Pasteurella canis]SUC09816.1 nitroreductase-like protein [Pasteurella canis]GJJ79384.1 putative NAD(P)H nitroreductase [Pasteurella canis]